MGFFDRIKERFMPPAPEPVKAPTRKRATSTAKKPAAKKATK